MIYSITGKVIHTELNMAVIKCNNIGYKCFTTSSTISKLSTVDDEVTLYTYLHVREDALDLFGFADNAELDCFKILISVSGVGPKVGLAILSELSPDKLMIAIASGDIKAIQRAPGVGPKLAQRIALELKDKVKGINFQGNISDNKNIIIENDIISQAVGALVMLGYTQTEANSAISGLPQDMTVEDMIKASLKRLSSIK